MKLSISDKAGWILSMLLLFSCESYLDERPSKSIVVPQTVEDLRSILNTPDIINTGDGFGLVLSDDLYTTDQGWLGYDEVSRNGYIWIRQLGNQNGDFYPWSLAYSNIFRTNVVLEEVEKLVPASEAEHREIEQVRGTALFLRAFHYFDLLQLFTHPIVEDADLDRESIPLKLTPGLEDNQGRASSQEIYTRIINDLNTASELLPVNEENSLRPSKAACYGLLARIFLQLNRYQEALDFTEDALAIQSELLDFNEIPALSTIPIARNNYPIPRFNKEVVIHLQASLSSYQFSAFTFIDPDLFGSFEENDIRKYLYFTEPDDEGRVNFVGNFTGSFQLFAGITTGELYLIRAECQARLAMDEQAASTLSTFMESRYFTGTYEPYHIEDDEKILDKILLERRKELVFRGSSRWRDLRRFLGDPEWEGPSERSIEGMDYMLGIDPSAYQMNIPVNEQALNDKL
ncbi:RagB/SusD family nutrient uptake outer membrane protein [Algoriphagus sp. D3-2-R+10]|uniref:RagB/SusD family nutrient uptake outer membrane protein n=1 Tax=Algoriphagus aurantiacus TaxID=3103948 RepID=UPI002B37C885|nr:RagB/SusD family nutrient uptake outer membrane protein [Algoriphagus sp. D3-2-R+10]MEB2777487.1 RagB/SusD family nutrient uptake outer membrane protein [Algoriphagus sp. D3-2-R+10]